MKEIKRLRVIADLIDAGDNIVADIGCDHGILSKMLIDENRASKVIATDISKQSLEKTNHLVNEYNLKDKIETRVGDGFNPLTNETLDYAIIAGMGGYEIIKILNNKNINVKKFILQPSKNQNVVELRKYLNANNYFIENDFVVQDRNKFYNTIVCHESDIKQDLSYNDIEFGLTNFDLQKIDFKNFLIDYIERKESVLNKWKSKEEFKVQIECAKNILKNLDNII